MDNRNQSLLDYIQHSFLRGINLEDYTDIMFNGKDLFGESTSCKKQILIPALSNLEVGNFLQHLANLLGKNFNTLNPILDVAFLTYRLNAIHPIIAKNLQGGVYNFSLRIYQQRLLIIPDNDKYTPKKVFHLLQKIIHNKLSVLISGVTGSGKTEFQKLLVSYIDERSRIVMIEDTYETFLKELYPQHDIITWVTFNNQEGLPQDISKLIKSALRSNPDWLIISEMRGKEASEVLTSLTTGHPLITTIHAISATKSIERFAHLLGLSSNDHEGIMNIIDYIYIAIHLEKKLLENNTTVRFIKQIVEYSYDKKKIIQNIVYEFDSIKPVFNDLSIPLKNKLGIKGYWYDD